MAELRSRVRVEHQRRIGDAAEIYVSEATDGAGRIT